MVAAVLCVDLLLLWPPGLWHARYGLAANPHDESCMVWAASTVIGSRMWADKSFARISINPLSSGRPYTLIPTAGIPGWISCPTSDISGLTPASIKTACIFIQRSPASMSNIPDERCTALPFTDGAIFFKSLVSCLGLPMNRGCISFSNSTLAKCSVSACLRNPSASLLNCLASFSLTDAFNSNWLTCCLDCSSCLSSTINVLLSNTISPA